MDESFKAHSVREASTSVAMARGVSLVENTECCSLEQRINLENNFIIERPGPLGMFQRSLKVAIRAPSPSENLDIALICSRMSQIGTKF